MNQILREHFREEAWSVSAARRNRLRLLLVGSLALALLPCCAEAGLDNEQGAIGALDAAAPSGLDTPDAGALPDASSVWVAPTPRADSGTGALPADTGTVAPDAAAGGAAGRDAGAPASTDEIGDLIDDLFGGGGAAGDAGFTPPDPAGGAWSLDDGSAAECPAEPPPIPIIGGPCIGIYFSCSWSNPGGEVYTCICDWVHWLCI